MSFDYTYAQDEKIKQDASSANEFSRAKISKGLKRLLIISGILILAELIWLFGITPFIPFSTVDIRGFDGLEQNDILRIALLDDTASYFSADTNKIKERLEANILVESAVVIKRFPDKLSIFLTPREPAAVSLSVINGKQVLVYVDKNGVFFKTEEQNLDGINMPVISGIENPGVYMRLPDLLAPLTMSLNDIQNSSPELLASISEIRIERKVWEGYELVLFPVHLPVRVRVENNLTEDILRYILLMLNVFDPNQDLPYEIDFRSGMGSFKELS